ncbi:UNVERIFIED_CONTAM: hypothetical protein Sradi_3580800 [Sesamum radiatum]|uniref:Uncharacterized protein n=1 Tax=Sesamum radiatum TaxID=300843 RepID=A0AAW2QGC3_SESRA
MRHYVGVSFFQVIRAKSNFFLWHPDDDHFTAAIYLLGGRCGSYQCFACADRVSTSWPSSHHVDYSCSRKVFFSIFSPPRAFRFFKLFPPLRGAVLFPDGLFSMYSFKYPI